MSNWKSFFEYEPAQVKKEIIIFNEWCEDTTLEMKTRVFLCSARDWKEVLGKNTLNILHTKWIYRPEI